jgi:predicted amidohydrolase YtcJ
MAVVNRNRRDFMRTSGIYAAGLVVGTPLAARIAHAATAPRVPDTIIINAKIYTVDDRMPQAQAFAIKNGRFMAVGSTAAIKALASHETQVVDAHGMTVLPGFIDCHNHAPGTQLMTEVLVGNPYDVEFVTIESIVDKLKARAQTTPPGYWVSGLFFDDTKVKDNRQLTVHDLDKVSTDHPVVVNHRGGHTSFYNSKALQLAGVTKDTANTASGTYDKDANGELNGRVTDTARKVFDTVGQHETFTPDQVFQRDRDGIAFISQQFVRYGLTSVHHSGGNLFALQHVRADGKLLHRVSYEATGDILENMIKSGIETGLGDEWIKFGATFEHNVDGSFSERTMALSTPYAGTNPPYYGNVAETQDQLNDWVERVHRAGIQVNCHANGDVAIDHMLTAVERAQKLFPRQDARPKVTHCTDINPDLVRRIKALGAVTALFTTYAYYNADKFHFYGEDMMKHMMAFRTLLDAGIPVCAGSDFTAGALAPLMGIQGMVTRKGWNGEVWGGNQKITVPEAIRVYTLNGAHASFEEGIKGSITPGKVADYIMLAADPHTVDPNTIKDIKIVRTVTGGQTVYQA